MALDQEVKASIIAKYGRKDGDTGSAEVQILLDQPCQRIEWHNNVTVIKNDSN